jgi:hypothetical protein
MDGMHEEHTCIYWWYVQGTVMPEATFAPADAYMHATSHKAILAMYELIGGCLSPNTDSLLEEEVAAVVEAARKRKAAAEAAEAAKRREEQEAQQRKMEGWDPSRPPAAIFFDADHKPIAMAGSAAVVPAVPGAAGRGGSGSGTSGEGKSHGGGGSGWAGSRDNSPLIVRLHADGAQQVRRKREGDTVTAIAGLILVSSTLMGVGKQSISKKARGSSGSWITAHCVAADAWDQVILCCSLLRVPSSNVLIAQRRTISISCLASFRGCHAASIFHLCL